MERLVGASCSFSVNFLAQEEDGKESAPRDSKEGKDRLDCDRSVRKNKESGIAMRCRKECQSSTVSPSSAS